MSRSQVLEQRGRMWPDSDAFDDACALFQLLADTSAPAIKGLKVEGLTTSCHQCGSQCVMDLCEGTPQSSGQGCGAAPRPGEERRQCMITVCRRCLQKHYGDPEFTKRGGKVLCPPCRGVCNCRRHLRTLSTRAPLRRCSRARLRCALQHRRMLSLSLIHI